MLGVRALFPMAAVPLLLASLVACDLDTDIAENLVAKQAERNQRRLLEQQREELPLPDPELVEYKTYTAADLELDEDFHVDLVDDLVIGEGRVGKEYLFVGFAGRSSALGNVAVDAEGRVFVLEARSGEVRIFAPDGEFLQRFGQPGEGPGDFQNPFGVVIAGDTVDVFHRSFLVSIWSLGGEFISQRQALLTPEAEAAAAEEDGRLERLGRRFRVPLRVFGRPDGSMISVQRVTPEKSGRIATPYARIISRLEDGVETERYLEVPEWARPSLAVAPDGAMYVAMFGHLGTERYIVALAPNGEPRFVIVTPWDIEMPPRTDLRVDGEGRLYAFPNFRAPEEDLRSPVHVFSRDGDLLGSGYANRRPLWTHWQVTMADRIYGVRVNPRSTEWEVVRYRLRVDPG